MDLSTRLSYLFGTEEYVDRRRQLVLLMDTLDRMKENKGEDIQQHQVVAPTERNVYIYNICSGSLGEGVAYPTSDYDVMGCRTDLRVVKTYREATQSGDVLMEPSKYSPGYCLLLDVNESCSENLIENIDEMPYFSSSLLKHSCLPEDRQFTQIHGPCLSGTVGPDEYDYACCIPCSTWPDVAKKWLTRNRSYNWPSCEIIQNIVGNGCHVVPVGDPDSPHCDHEWRISFSVAERTLMHSFNHVQFLVYNLLRLTLKGIIEKSFPGVLCSYFMKTTLFYTAEKTSMEFWRENNLESCFKTCLSKLYDYVDNIYCPNYFIPEYNMIKRKISHTNRHGMLNLIGYIHNIGIVGILHESGESQCLNDALSAKDIEYKLDEEFMSSDHLYNAFSATANFFLSLPHEAVASYTDCLSTFSRILSECTQNELGIMIWYRGINSYCIRIMDCLFTSPRNDQHNNRLDNTLNRLLTIGFRQDLTTGKLIMATYRYMVGKTESTLYVLQQLLSDYPPYDIDGSGDDLKRRTYIDVMCGRGYSIEYKARRAYVPDYSLDSRCLNAFIYPMKMLIFIMERYAINSLTYTFLLQSLCYVQLRNSSSMKRSTKCLVDHIDELKDDTDVADARMCVGIIKYVQGDYQSACRWMGSVYIIADELDPPYNKRYSSSVLTYMSCLLNKHFRGGGQGQS